MNNSLLKKVHWVLSSQFGLNLLLFIKSLRGVPQFVVDFISFRKGYDGAISLKPCLHDRYDEAGLTKSEYFWQDLVVARFINGAVPMTHVDVGSRIDGFVAHVASFREIEVFDIRPITAEVPGVVFKQADVMSTELPNAYCDSLSCLHALEHFGLGRYGDLIDPDGYESGFSNMVNMLKDNGTFYLSTPIGNEKVEFNANWIFSPFTIIELGKKSNLELAKLFTIDSNGQIKEIALENEYLKKIEQSPYYLGVFIFKKVVKALDGE